MSNVHTHGNATTKVTILGATGFIGSHLAERLCGMNAEVFAPTRKDQFFGQDLGNVIYCIGLTADFRAYPLAAVEAHVCRLRQVLQECNFGSLLYLSSARIYRRNSGPAHENDVLSVNPQRVDDLYNISKIMGESLALSHGKNCRVARLSNVYGNDFQSQNFLPTLIKAALAKGEVTIRNSPEAAKDYISLSDVVDVLIKIALNGQQLTYNVASGVNVSNRELADRLSNLTGCRVMFDATASSITFPTISVDRIREEFGFKPRSVLEDLGDLIASYRKHH